MRNILLSLVMVAVLVAAGVGSVFPCFSDTEVSEANNIQTGSLDLLVNGLNDPLPKIIDEQQVNPGEIHKYTVTVQNAGDKDGYLYFHLKYDEFPCYNYEDPAHNTWWTDDPNVGGTNMKPEPELVAEYGGKVDCRTVAGFGYAVGDECSMTSHVGMVVKYRGAWVIGNGTNDCSLWPELKDLECVTKYLGVLPLSGGTYALEIWFCIPQLDDPNWPGDHYCPELAYWPTNSLMADGIDFDLEFLLFDAPLP